MWWIASTFTMHLNQAVDEVRRRRAGGSGPKGGSRRATQEDALALLRRGSRVRGRARQKLKRSSGQQASDRPGLGVEGDFFPMSELQIVTWAAAFLDYWCYRAMRSRLEPMKKSPECCVLTRNCC